MKVHVPGVQPLNTSFSAPDARDVSGLNAFYADGGDSAIRAFHKTFRTIQHASHDHSSDKEGQRVTDRYVIAS
jgi:hypothetical protein